MAVGAELTTKYVGTPYHAAQDSLGNAPLTADIKQVLGHAAVGCALGSALSGNCGSGAAGAVAGELGAEWTDSADTGKVMGAYAGLLAGGGAEDVNTAYTTANNAVDNNYLETAWDAAQIALDTAKIAKGKELGDEEMVLEGQVDLAADTAAATLPIIPGGLTKVARWLGVPVDKIAKWFDFEKVETVTQNVINSKAARESSNFGEYVKREKNVLQNNKRQTTVNFPDVYVDKNKYPESAKHIEDAQSSGYPSELTIDRLGASQRRSESLRNVETRPNLDRDEYPPAMFEQGGNGASVRHINPSDNRGAGACIGAQCKGLPDGSKVNIKVKD